ncbi:MAG: SDR family NAD(P)-dependent oxidoreductase [Bacteroidales bacterium]
MEREKKAIVVGATSGIGRAIAQLLLSQGYSVGILGRREELLKEIESATNGVLYWETLDVTQIDKIAPTLDRLEERLGGVDYFFHSAGWGKRNHNLDLDIELLTTTTNVEGFVASLNWAYRYFEGRGGGSLAAISSFAGLRGFALSPSYSASKSFQMTYLEGLRQKSCTSKAKIGVTDIRAGFVDTDMGNGAGAFWQCSPEVAAKQIVRAVLRDRDVAYVTKRWVVLSWFVRALPRSIFKRIKL